MRVIKREYTERGFRSSDCLDDNSEQPFTIREDSCVDGGVWLFPDHIGIDIRDEKSIRQLVKEMKKVLTGKGWKATRVIGNIHEGEKK